MNMNTKMHMNLLVLSLCGAIAATGCRQLHSDADERESRASRDRGDVTIGVVWTSEAPDGFLDGVSLAAERVNTDGGIMGRTLELLMRDDEGSLITGKIVAQELAENLDLVAVIGHKQSEVAMVTSVIYEYANVVMICPGSSSRRLARDGFRRVFRTLPGEDELGAALAALARQRGLRRVLIAYANDYHGRALANAFEARAEEHRIRVVERLSYDVGGARSFERSLGSVDDLGFEGILLAARMPDAADIMEMIRGRGFKEPVIAGVGLDDPSFVRLPKGLSEGALVASVFHPDVDDREVAGFVRAFEAKYGKKPDTWAAQGYDAVRLLAEAMSIAGSTSPRLVSDTLRSLVGWHGATGRYRFNQRGEVAGKPVVHQKVQGGRLVLVDTSTRS